MHPLRRPRLTYEKPPMAEALVTPDTRATEFLRRMGSRRDPVRDAGRERAPLRPPPVAVNP